MLLTENTEEIPEVIFVDSRFSWDWISVLSCLAVITAYLPAPDEVTGGSKRVILLS